MFPSYKPYLRDISQLYTQSTVILLRKIFLKPVKEMKTPKEIGLIAVKPLYGIPESGLYWFSTYSKHHKEELKMSATTYDPCVLYQRKAKSLNGITILQVDDSFGAGSKLFLEKESQTGRKFLSKPRELFKENTEKDFNGLRIRYHGEGKFKLLQQSKMEELKIPNNQEDFESERAKIQYIGNCTRPDLSAPVQLLASSSANPSKEDFRSLSMIIKHCYETCDVGLSYVPLDRNSVRLVLFTDASFANAKDLKSQIGFVLVALDKNMNANIVHYGSSRCKRTTRSVMAAEVHGLTFGWDNAFVVKAMLEEVLGTKIRIDVYVDSKTLFNVIVKYSTTMEKRLQIDVAAI